LGKEENGEERIRGRWGLGFRRGAAGCGPGVAA